MRRTACLVVVAIALAAGLAGCKKKQALPPVTEVQQASAMQLGFAVGSFTAQQSQPLELRKESAVGFLRSESDLLRFMARIPINDTDAASATSALLDGFADPNPSRGAQLVSEGINLLMQRLADGSYPELLWVFKAGVTVGHSMEIINVLTHGTPGEEHIPAFAALTLKNRQTLQADLDQSNLPQEWIDVIQGVNIEPRSVSDLLSINRACLKVRSLVRQIVL